MTNWLACFLVTMVACGSDARSPDVDAGGGEAISFQRDVVPLIGHCGGEMCHGGLAGATWPYSALVEVAATECDDQRVRVKPGDPDGSYLIQKLSGSHMCSGVRMPRLGTPLSDADMRKIEDWIRQGAPNN
jgi:hypothetical protein